MKKLISFVAICLLFSGVAFADDPGARDSIIVDSISVPNGQTFAFVHIYMTSDDSIGYYNLPLGWFPRNSNVHAGSGTQYFTPLTTWDMTYDTLMLNEGFMRQFGFCDLMDTSRASIPLMTNNVRVNAWNLRYVIPSDVRDQYITLDTVTDSRSGPMICGLMDGMTEFQPVFKRGYIRIGNPEAGVDEDVIPNIFALNQNYPNPFNPETNIEFALPKEQNVVLTVYNVLGQNIRTLINEKVGAGNHTVRWNGKNDMGSDVPSGIYFYKILTPEFSQTNKMLLVR